MTVNVYRNVRRNDWSVKQGSKVVDHKKLVFLKNAVFHVNQNGRRKVLETGQKNVHAWVRGERVDVRWWLMPNDRPRKVRYNPKETNTFELVDGTPVTSAEFVVFYPGGLVVAYGVS